MVGRVLKNKAFRLFSFLTLVSIIAIAYAHETGVPNYVRFIDGTARKGLVGYCGECGGGGQWVGLWGNGASYVAVGTNDATDVNFFTNNYLRSQVHANGSFTEYNIDGTVNTEGRSMSKNLTNNTATNILALGTASNTNSSVRVDYGITVLDGTDEQVYTGVLSCRANNKAGTVTASCTDVPDGSSPYKSAGTHVVTWAIGATTTGQITLTSNSSLSPTTHVIKYKYTNMGTRVITEN